MAELPDDPAEVRTQFAEDRTLLASERTFAGWMKASLGCVAIGVGFHALFAKIDPDWLPRAIATAFLALAILVVVLAQRRAAAVTRRLSAHVIKTANAMNLRLFAGVIALGAGALIAVIWTLPIG